MSTFTKQNMRTPGRPKMDIWNLAILWSWPFWDGETVTFWKGSTWPPTIWDKKVSLIHLGNNICSSCSVAPFGISTSFSQKTLNGFNQKRPVLLIPISVSTSINHHWKWFATWRRIWSIDHSLWSFLPYECFWSNFLTKPSDRLSTSGDAWKEESRGNIWTQETKLDMFV